MESLKFIPPDELKLRDWADWFGSDIIPCQAVQDKTYYAGMTQQMLDNTYSPSWLAMRWRGVRPLTELEVATKSEQLISDVDASHVASLVTSILQENGATVEDAVQAVTLHIEPLLRVSGAMAVMGRHLDESEQNAWFWNRWWGAKHSTAAFSAAMSGLQKCVDITQTVLPELCSGPIRTYMAEYTEEVRLAKGRVDYQAAGELTFEALDESITMPEAAAELTIGEWQKILALVSATDHLYVFNKKLQVSADEMGSLFTWNDVLTTTLTFARQSAGNEALYVMVLGQLKQGQIDHAALVRMVTDPYSRFLGRLATLEKSYPKQESGEEDIVVLSYEQVRDAIQSISITEKKKIHRYVVEDLLEILNIKYFPTRAEFITWKVENSDRPNDVQRANHLWTAIRDWDKPAEEESRY